MERLTKIIAGYPHGTEGISKDRLTGNYCRGEFEATACVEKLEEYEDLEEKGLLVKLPCPLGTTVYVIELDEENFDSFHLARKISEYPFDYYFIHLIGKCAFLTKEEAEQAMNGTKQE